METLAHKQNVSLGLERQKVNINSAYCWNLLQLYALFADFVECILW